LDSSLGNVYKLVPEINLCDITEAGSDFLLDLLRHRAMKSLFEQYSDGADGCPGDLDFIEKMMRTHDLRYVEAFSDCYTMFLDDEKYGESYQILSNHTGILSHITPAI
jgi:hypothetical protein